jgi:hypothetical protein
MKKIILYILFATTMIISLDAVDFTWYSQGDDRWDGDRLGNSGTTIGRSGCVLSCLSMLLNGEASNPRITPALLNSWLKRNGGFAGNLMKWQVPGEIDGSGSGMELVSQINKVNDWDYLSGELAKGNKVIVRVSGKRSHWVLVVNRDGPANCAGSYKINDPATSSYQNRTLAYYGGFRAARSYSGNWLDEQAFDLESRINIVPVQSDEQFLYQLSRQPIPADVYVTLENKLTVEITGYFMLGLFDSNDKLIRVVDYDYASIGPKEDLDLLFEMADISPVNDQFGELRIVYSKYFSSIPSLNDALALPNPGLNNLTNVTDLLQSAQTDSSDNPIN